LNEGDFHTGWRHGGIGIFFQPSGKTKSRV